MACSPLILSAALVAIELGFSPAPALRRDPAIKCEVTKLQTAGDYGSCRLNANAKAVKSGGPPDFSKCDQKYGSKWTEAETKADGMCPSNGDEAAIQAFITQCTDDVAAALAGGPLPDCPGDLALCNGNLSVCNGSLNACNSDLGTCNSDLGTCQSDLATCQSQSRVLQTGQTDCFGDFCPFPPVPPDPIDPNCHDPPEGQDCEVQAGAARSFTDNGDGTITDNVTGLMWEKLGENIQYTWYDAFNVIATLNGGGGFAGHTDWRLPNVNELHSLADYSFRGNFIDTTAATVPAFDDTQQDFYWSSTIYGRLIVPGAWGVDFYDGSVLVQVRDSPHYVRAVRGGL